MYWFVALEKITKFRSGKARSIYSTLSVEENELLVAFKTDGKWLKKDKNQAKLKKRKYTYFAV